MKTESLHILGWMIQRTVPIVLAALAICAGCNHGARDTLAPSRTEAASDLPSGWKRLVANDDPISIGIPKDWIPVEMSVDTFDEKVDANTSSHQPTVNTAAEKAAANNQYKLMFRSTVIANGRHASGVIVQEPLKLNENLKQEADANVAFLRKTRPVVDETELTLPAGPSVQIRYDAVSNGTLLTHLSYCFVKDRNFYLVGFSLPTGDVNDEELAEQMIKTFRLTGSN